MLLSLNSIYNNCLTNSFSSLNKSLNELARDLFKSHLTLSDIKKHKSELKKALHLETNFVPLNSFIENYVQWAIVNDQTEALDFLSELISLEKLTAIVQRKTQNHELLFEDVETLVCDLSLIFPSNMQTTLTNQLQTEWKKLKQRTIHFIPHLMQTFTGAFDFLDASKKFTSLWEKHLLIDIVFRFFLMPYLLANFLTPFMATAAKAYFVAGIIMASSMVTVAVYQKWLKPCPEAIINCTNLDRLMENGYIDPLVGQTEELQKLLASLLAGSNVLIIGQSGEGKTALMNQLVQLKKEQKLPGSLQRRKSQEIDCGSLISNLSFGHSELINQMKEQMEGFEDQTLLFFDEIDHLTKQSSAFNAFKKRFLQDHPKPLFVATTTHEGYEKIKEMDDGSFERRLVKIVLPPASDEQIRLILNTFIARQATDILVAEDATNQLIHYASKPEFFKKIARPAKAVKLLTDAIGICRANFALPFQTEEYQQSLQAIEQIKASHQFNLSASTQQRMRQLANTLKTEQSKSIEQQKIIERIKCLIKNKQAAKQKQYNVVTKLNQSRHQKDQWLGKDQKNLLLQTFYEIEMFSKIIHTQKVLLDNKVCLEVNADLIQQVYEQAKDIEETLQLS